MAETILYIRAVGSDASADLWVMEEDITAVQVVPGNARVSVRLTRQDREDLENIFGEDADLQVCLEEDVAWHNATIVYPDRLCWWAGYR